jgi:hypothetical protein
LNEKRLNEKRPTLLLAAAKWWPLAARLAVALRDHGCDVAALCPARHPLGHVSGLRALYRYRGLDSIGSLADAIRDYRPDVVIPCDDGVVAQLHALHEQHPSLRPVIESSLGPARWYPVVRSRQRLLSLAAQLGIRVPDTQPIESESDLAAWHEQHGPRAVVKLDGDNGGNGVSICGSLEDATAALHRFQGRPGALTAMKRLIVDHDPLALWQRRSPLASGVSVQKFIDGRPANCMFACYQGALLGLISVVVVASEGPTGAATVVRVVQDESMRKAAQHIAAALNLTGFYGLDFIIEAAGGEPYLIEMNPRCTQLGHLELPLAGSLAGAFAAVLRGAAQPPPKQPLPCERVALYPQAQAAGAACRPLIESSHHDVPAGEPELVRELERGPWPMRHWPARLYHAFNRVEKATPMLFEAVPHASPHAGTPESVQAAAASARLAG